MLTGYQQPNHSRNSDFRYSNLDAPKVKANPSNHQARSQERILRAEKQLAQEIIALMRKAKIHVAVRLPRSGCPGGPALPQTNRGSDLPGELRRSQDRLGRIRLASKEMEAETEAEALQRQREAEQARAEADAA